MKSEPAITIGGISAGVGAVIALCVAFGVPLTEDQQIAILGVVAALGPIIAAVVTRRFVSPAAAQDRDREPTHRANV